MKNKKFIIILISLVALSIVSTVSVLGGINASKRYFQTQTVSVRSVGQSIIGQGEIHSAQEATLHFQTGGKLTYFPFKEGDYVYAGQTVAQLDTYVLQQQLATALNNYRSTRDVFDQTQQNAANGVLKGQQSANLEGKNLGLPTTTGLNADDNLTNTVNDIVTRIVDENQANLDNSVIGVQLANYAVQLASIQAPFNGVITHEDVTSADQNVTPATAITLADPNQLVFKARISSQDIDFLMVGAKSTISLTGWSKKIQGTVTKIYPQPIIVNGETLYQVDIIADGLQNLPFGQTGMVSIVGSNKQATTVIPTWAVVGHQYVWVLENNKPVLQKVVVGPSHAETTEIYSGLKNNERIILNPNVIATEENIIL